jgi:hypothetical protein
VQQWKEKQLVRKLPDFTKKQKIKGGSKLGDVYVLIFMHDFGSKNECGHHSIQNINVHSLSLSKNLSIENASI